MAITFNDDFNFKTVQEAFERASQYFYRLEKLANSAIEINGLKYGEFKDPLYREECVYYQLESIRDLSKQFESLFNDVATTLGRESDLRLKPLEDAPSAETAFIADFQASSEIDQDFILVQSHFMARKYWTEGMRCHLSELAKLCAASNQGQKLAEMLLKDSGEGVLAGIPG